jgi:hypothetical protein
MSDEENKPSLKLTGGSEKGRRAPEITAEGKEKSRLLATKFGGCAIILMLAIYGVLAWSKPEGARDLLTLVGTAFGLYVGRLSGRGD